jgi:hypothetical protein
VIRTPGLLPNVTLVVDHFHLVIPEGALRAQRRVERGGAVRGQREGRSGVAVVD